MPGRPNCPKHDRRAIAGGAHSPHAQSHAVAIEYRNAAVRELGRKGIRWVLADGYMDVWYYLHRAEEALIASCSREAAIAQALYDEQRLDGSLISIRDELLDQLRHAVVQLAPAAAAYLQKQASGQMTPRWPLWQVKPRAEDPEARAVLRKVRRALNEFRDDRFEGIRTARNRLAALSMVGGILAYALLYVALVGGITVASVVPVTVFYLIGAVTGVFNSWAALIMSDTAIPDHGLSRARMIAILIFGGLAALGGVLILNEVLSPDTRSNLEAMYVLTPGNLIIAAAFGLTPRLVISVLQQQTDRYTREIKSTLATQQAQQTQG